VTASSCDATREFRPFLRILKNARGDTVDERKVDALSTGKVKYDQLARLPPADWGKALALSKVLRAACDGAWELVLSRHQDLSHQLNLAKRRVPRDYRERDELDARIAWLRAELLDVAAEMKLARASSRDLLFVINNAMQGLGRPCYDLVVVFDGHCLDQDDVEVRSGACL
jgi:hypothetical protein